MAERLKDLHLADLHARAAELGVPGYRMLRRDQLVAEITERDGDAAAEPQEAPEPRRGGGRRGPSRRSDRSAGVSPRPSVSDSRKRRPRTWSGCSRSRPSG